jgi:hypothetical protein
MGAGRLIENDQAGRPAKDDGVKAAASVHMQVGRSDYIRLGRGIKIIPPSGALSHRRACASPPGLSLCHTSLPRPTDPDGPSISDALIFFFGVE